MNAIISYKNFSSYRAAVLKQQNVALKV